MSYTPIPYPRRLYLNGEVIPGDLHAINSVVVEDAEAEEDARSKGYRKAWEPAPIGGNGGSPSESSPPDSTTSWVSAHFPLIQGDVAVTYATSDDPDDGVDPADDDGAELTREELLLKAQEMGLDPHHRTGKAKLLAMIAEAKVAV